MGQHGIREKFMNGNLQDLIRNRIASQEQNIAGQRQALSQMQQQPQQMDLSPLMALTDAWTGSNLSRAYQQMKPKQVDPMRAQALQQQLMQQEQGLIGDQIALLKLEEMRKRQAMQKPVTLTPGEKKKDETFAKEASEWEAAGGFASFAGNLDRLKGASKDLAKEGDLGNTVMPKFMRDVFNPESSEIEENIGFVAQQSLKQILGGQFSEKEAQQLIERTYNPRLPDATNKRKIDALVKQLEAQGKAKQQAVEYFNKQGTLKGFKGTSATTLNEFEKELKTKIMGKSGGDKKSRLEELRKKAGF